MTRPAARQYCVALPANTGNPPRLALRQHGRENAVAVRASHADSSPVAHNPDQAMLATLPAVAPATPERRRRSPCRPLRPVHPGANRHAHQIPPHCIRCRAAGVPCRQADRHCRSTAPAVLTTAGSPAHDTRPACHKKPAAHGDACCVTVPAMPGLHRLHPAWPAPVTACPKC